MPAASQPMLSPAGAPQKGQLTQGLCLGPQGQRQHAVSKQPTPHTDLQHTLLEEELGTAELSEQ